MIPITKKTKHHFINWRIKNHTTINFYNLPIFLQQAMVVEFFAKSGIFIGLESIIPYQYWLESDDTYGYGKWNYIFFEKISSIDRAIKIANIIYNKKHTNGK